MSPRILTRAVGAAFGVAAVAVAVFFLWPVQLGGWTAYAVIDGSSMEPRLHTGDLVVTRKRADYAVGDPVLYQSDVLRSHVYHRIVSIADGQITLRGDNRRENDPAPVTASAILGSEWLVVPGAGRPLDWLARPVNLAIACFVLVLLALAGGREVARRRRRGVDPVPVAVEPLEREETPRAATAGRGLLYAGAVAMLAFGVLSLAAWTRSTTDRATVVGAYAHTGTFSYAARARRGAAYPDGVVQTGQPVFVRLSRSVDVAFDYRFTSDDVADVRGGIALDAVVADGQGWSRTLPLSNLAPFSGSTARAVGRLDLGRVERLVLRLQTSTGANVPQARVTIVPRVTVSGYAGDQVVDEQFTPELPFTLDTVALRLASTDDASPTDPSGNAVPTTPLTPRTDGSSVVEAPASLALGPIAAIEVQRARAVSIVGILVALAALMLGALLLLRRATGSEADRIEARYGSRVVRARATIPEGRWVTELHDPEALLRLAEAYDRVVLRVTESDGRDAFLVDDGIAVYRYRPDPVGPLGTPRTLPVHGR